MSTQAEFATYVQFWEKSQSYYHSEHLPIAMENSWRVMQISLNFLLKVDIAP